MTLFNSQILRLYLLYLFGVFCDERCKKLWHLYVLRSYTMDCWMMYVLYGFNCPWTLQHIIRGDLVMYQSVCYSNTQRYTRALHLMLLYINLNSISASSIHWIFAQQIVACNQYIQIKCTNELFSMSNAPKDLLHHIFYAYQPLHVHVLWKQTYYILHLLWMFTVLFVGYPIFESPNDCY